MEFVPLRNLQRGLPEVWQTLRRENGRIVLTSKGQPAFLLIDLADKNVVSLINYVDEYPPQAADGREKKANPAVEAAIADYEAQQRRLAVEKFLADTAAYDEKDSILTDADWEEMANLRSFNDLHNRKIDL